MAAIYTGYCLLLALTGSCLAASVSHDDLDQFRDGYLEEKVAEFINRLKRERLDENRGYSVATVQAEDPVTGDIRRLTRRDVLTHVTHPSSASRRVSLELESGERIHMALTRRSVVASATKIVERLADNVEIIHQVPQDCYFSGPLDGALGHASLSFCGQQLMGTLQTENRQYEVHPLPKFHLPRHRRLASPARVLVTWKERLEKDPNNVKNSALEENQGDSRLSDEDDDWMDDEIEAPLIEEEEEEVLGRRHDLLKIPEQRDSSSGDVIVEVGAFMDTFHRESLVDQFGFNDTQQFINLAILKWSGIWSVLSDPKLRWNITVRLVHLEIWNDNPEWYNSHENTTLDARLNRICQRTMQLPLDHVMLWTFAKSNGKMGLSWTKGVCSQRYRCSAIQRTALMYSTELHELGHNLGLPHDNEMNCSESEPEGFMGSSTAYVRSCYRDKLDKAFPEKDCLFRESYSTADTESLKMLSVGQQLGFDGQCQFKYGKEFIYLPGSESLCEVFPCIANDSNKNNYGSVRKGRPAIGTACAPGRLCMGGGCPPLANTSYPRVLESNTIVDGGWSAWTPLSDCKRSRSGAAAFTVASRLCNNPEPKYGAYCEGDPFKAELCGSSLRESDVSSALDLEDLASEICTYQRGVNKSGGQNSNYTGRGQVVDARGIDAIERCTVHCQLNNGHFSKASYILPDGILCGSSSLDELRGVRKFCLKGVCTLFGCNNQTLGDGGGIVKDVCGVCGGQRDSCIHGEFVGPLLKGKRHTVTIVPLEATDIYVKHVYDEKSDIDMDKSDVDMEIFSVNGQAILSPTLEIGYSGGTGSHSVSFGGTRWFLDKLRQTLTASGPLNHRANITIFSKSQHDAVRVVYRYNIEHHREK